METANEHKPAYKLLENHIPGKDIILYDRGFASAALIKKLEEKGVKLISHKEKLDTSTPSGKLMVTMLGAIYEFERANLLERQRDGIAVAKMQGKYKGRKQVAKPANFDEIYRKWQKREIKSSVAIRELNISEYAFYKFVRDSQTEAQEKGCANG